MMINKKTKMYFGGVTALSILVLSFHMLALKFIYNYIGLMLSANGLTGEKQKEIVVQAENLKNYSQYCTNAFLLANFFFLIIIGIILLTRKINLKMYLCSYLLFEVIQIIGISIFIQIFNRYELTEGFGRWRILHRNVLFWIIFIIPIIIYLSNRKQKT
ncbi:hypothetical protein RZO55_25360 [Clostridium boliviensis]|uniref:Uncharacterized protein n=1 Tax=Clostridium boliviensis TaxID=318465 RepID=A0ABU4GTC5_9CLOT|nr:hypothetical protein [Clostridium boliviensis]MDW2800901.1 hypothetical protein [Clostridium boliviensis]